MRLGAIFKLVATATAFSAAWENAIKLRLCCHVFAQDAITFRQPSASTSSSRKSSSSSSSHTPTLSVYSVDQLLSYSEDDTKESTFEVSAAALSYDVPCRTMYSIPLVTSHDSNSTRTGCVCCTPHRECSLPHVRSIQKQQFTEESSECECFRVIFLQVSLFAELFREMLHQRYGRVLLRGLTALLAKATAAAAAQKAKDKEREKEKAKEKEKEKEKDKKEEKEKEEDNKDKEAKAAETEAAAAPESQVRAVYWLCVCCVLMRASAATECLRVVRAGETVEGAYGSGQAVLICCLTRGPCRFSSMLAVRSHGVMHLFGQTPQIS